MAHPTLQKFRGRLVSVRCPGLRGKRTGWVIDEDFEGYAWRDDLGDAEDQVHAGELIPVVYLGEIDDGELVQGEGFLLYDPKSLDLYLVDEGSLEDVALGSLEELVLTPLAGDDEDDDDDDEDFVEEPADDDPASNPDGVEEEEYKEEDTDD